MSGGFFRGTSADQDTRFSNKQAKLLKSQKFPPELDHLVDMTKVKMDVIRPWIATRATELLGFEDEVLINFIYGLLEGKAVDGKAIQIQITGFMEKNTGKFMKELWILLLSAQSNASGVPQQFLDAKEEEMRKKKVETDRIATEIRSRREKEREAGMDGEAEHLNPKGFNYSDEEREADGRHGRRPHNRDRSKSRSLSGSSLSRRRSRSPRRRSISLSRRDRSPRISISPPRRSSPQGARSPVRRGSPPPLSLSPRPSHSPGLGRSPLRRSRRRSRSNSRHRSPSPPRRRSPYVRRRSPYLRRRSRSPLRRRSPSPSRRYSPVRRRSPSPSRRRSPVRRRSPSPSRCRSPVRRRSRSPSGRRSPIRRRSPIPSRRRSPIRRRSLSPAMRRSLSPPRRRSPPRPSKNRHSPRNYVTNSQLSPRQRKRSRSPYRSRSPPYRNRRNLSRERENFTNGFESKRTHEKKSPSHYASAREVAERLDSGPSASDSKSHRLPISLMSPQRNTRDQSGNHDKVPNTFSEESPEQSISPPHPKKATSISNRSLSCSPVQHSREQRPRYDSPEDSSREEEDTNRATARNRELAESDVRQVSPAPVAEDGLGKVKEESFSSIDSRDKQAPKQQAGTTSSLQEPKYNQQAPKHSGVVGRRVGEERQPLSKSEKNIESQYEKGPISKSKAKLDKSNLLDTVSSDTAEAEAYTKKRKHRKSDRNKKHADGDTESDSEVDDRKMAKRRRKEEKRLRKEERRRRREERHHRKSERRVGKLTARSTDNDFNGSDKSDGGADTRMVSDSNDTEPESEQKKLEIELRKKALESLRAKKAISD